MSGESHLLPVALGRYRPCSVLGTGAMGVVYRAYDPLIERSVAIKIMRAEAIQP
jgi:serine/threonine-protein kinase